MKCTGLDSKTYSWNLSQYIKNGENPNKSELHLLVRKLLKLKYPLEYILEEVYLPGTNQLHVDFYRPKGRTIYECQGEQHHEFTHFFHKTKLAFFQAKQRDRLKREWAAINNITLVEIKYDETEEAIQRKI